MEETILILGEILIVLCIVGVLYGLLQIYKHIQILERKLIKWARFYKQELYDDVRNLTRIQGGLLKIDKAIEIKREALATFERIYEREE